MVPAPVLLQLDFTAKRSDLCWVADITEFACVDGKLYLAWIRDLHDRGPGEMVHGRASDHRLVVAALVMALGRRNPSDKLFHHADHGSPYTSVEFTTRLADWGLAGSYGSVGDCFDNAAIERSGPRSRRRSARSEARRATSDQRCARSCSTASRSSTTGNDTNADSATTRPPRHAASPQPDQPKPRAHQNGANSTPSGCAGSSRSPTPGGPTTVNPAAAPTAESTIAALRSDSPPSCSSSADLSSGATDGTPHEHLSAQVFTASATPSPRLDGQ